MLFFFFNRLSPSKLRSDACAQSIIEYMKRQLPEKYWTALIPTYRSSLKPELIGPVCTR